jgi:hypothetical protein
MLFGEEFRASSSLLLIPLGPKYPPQHSILENLHTTFLPQCEWQSFTTIQNNRQDYSSVYVNLDIFGLLTSCSIHILILRKVLFKSHSYPFRDLQNS